MEHFRKGVFLERKKDMLNKLISIPDKIVDTIDEKLDTFYKKALGVALVFYASIGSFIWALIFKVNINGGYIIANAFTSLWSTVYVLGIATKSQ